MEASDTSTTTADNSAPSNETSQYSLNSSEGSGSSQQGSDNIQDVGFNLDADFSDDSNSGVVNNDNQSQSQEEEYRLELPDDFDGSDDFKQLLTAEAKASGLNGKQAGKYVSSVIASIQKSEADAIKKSTEQLKQDWGSNFSNNMNQVKQFTAKLRAKAGLSSEDLAPLQSPKGFRLLYALMKSTSEDSFVGNGSVQRQRSNAEEARAMLTDPSHPDFQALDDVSHPRHMEANRKYNRLVGLG
jgi:hypothetical protein